MELFVIADRAVAGSLEQRLVRRTVPEPRRQPRSECYRPEPAAGLGALRKKQHLRAREHRDIGPPHGIFKAVAVVDSCLHECHVGFNLGRLHLAAEGPRQKGRQQPRGIFGRLARLHRLQRRLPLRPRNVEVFARQVARRTVDRGPRGRHRFVATSRRRDRQVGEETPVALRWPRWIERPLHLEPVDGHTRADVLGRPAADLPHAEASPGNRNRIEDDRLVGVEPGHDLVRAGHK